jgi:hypothetical protein
LLLIYASSVGLGLHFMAILLAVNVLNTNEGGGAISITNVAGKDSALSVGPSGMHRAFIVNNA